MLYLLTFMGGTAFGVCLMCIFVVSGQESRREEEYECKRKIKDSKI